MCACVLDCDSGSSDKPKVDSLTCSEEKAEYYGNESTLPLLLHTPHTHPQKGNTHRPTHIHTYTHKQEVLTVFVCVSVCAGILKKKPLSPIAERNGLHRIHNQLSVSPSGSTSSKGPGASIGSSPIQGQGGGATQTRPNGAATSVRTVREVQESDSSGSE